MPRSISWSAGSDPTPRVRSSQIGFCDSSPSYSSMRDGISVTNWRNSFSKPGGMSSAQPPTWKYRWFMRSPEIISNRSSARSRSR